MAETKNDFVISSGVELSLTAGHYLYVNGNLAAAGTVRAGEAVESATGARLAVISVCSDSTEGLYNPLFVYGAVIINGILASVFTSAIPPSAAHIRFAPLRAVYARLGFVTAAVNQDSDFLDNQARRVGSLAYLSVVLRDALNAIRRGLCSTHTILR